MTPEQFDQFIEEHPQVSWTPARVKGECLESVEIEDATGLAFRVEGVSWYENPHNVTFISAEKTRRMEPHDLMPALARGLDMEHITRITGYFTKVSSWNKGKRGELNDRYRNPGFTRAA